MKLAKRALTAILAIVMTLSLAGCSDTSWALKSGDDTIPAGVYLSYLFDAYYGQIYSYSYTGQDPSKVFDNKIEDKDPVQWMKDTAMESLKKNIVYRNYMNELGVSLTDEEKANSLKQADQMYDSLSASLKQGGVGKESFRTYFEQSMAASKVFNAIYGEEGTKPVPTKDIRSYWEENYYRVKVISAPLLNTEGAALTDTEKKVITDRLDTYKTQINAGEAKVDDLIETEKKVQAATSDDKSDSSDDSADTEKKDTASYVTKKDDTDAERAKALKDAQVGKAVSYTSNNYYYVVTLLPYDGDDKDLVNTTFDSKKSSLLQEMKGEEFDNDIKGRLESTTFEINESAVKRYDPKKFLVSSK